MDDQNCWSNLSCTIFTDAGCIVTKLHIFVRLQSPQSAIKCIYLLVQSSEVLQPKFLLLFFSFPVTCRRDTSLFFCLVRLRFWHLIPEWHISVGTHQRRSSSFFALWIRIRLTVPVLEPLGPVEALAQTQWIKCTLGKYNVFLNCVCYFLKGVFPWAEETSKEGNSVAERIPVVLSCVCLEGHK